MITEKLSLNQIEIHLFGKLLLENINEQYTGLISDADNISGMELDLELFKKISMLVVNLQGNKKKELRIERRTDMQGKELK